MADTSSSRPRRPTRDAPKPPPLDVEPQQDSGADAPLVSSPTRETDESAEKLVSLTPLRAHYLKKTLIQLQFRHELDAITTSAPNNVSTFSYLGPPFNPPPKDAPPLDLPFLRYIFRQFVLTFPFLNQAPKDFFPEKLQPFMVSVLSRNLSPSSIFDEGGEGSEQATRIKLLRKAERNFAMFLGSATKLAEREEVVRLSQKDLDRLELMAKKRYAREQRIKETFDVNVICVRTVVDKGRVRSKVHEEFIIRTRRTGQPDVYVSRRYGDFRTLAEEATHPDENVPSPPAKDRTIVNAPMSAPITPSPSTAGLFRTTTTSTTGSSDSLNVPPSPSSAASYGGFPSQPMQSSSSSQLRLAREKNRLTLRSYLHTLLASSTLGSSPVLKSFLVSMPTALSEEEKCDAQRREEADRMRDDGRKRFAQEVKDRVEGLRGAVRGVKGDIMGKGGLTRVFATIKTTESVRELPPEYQAVIEWARISLASTIFHHLVAADNASETFASLKRIHGLMPYFMLKTALRISNPMGMIRSVLDLFLAQPFGQRSLLQRMFTSSLTEEVHALEEDIEAVKDKVDDPVLCEKIRAFVYAPREIQEIYKADAAAENLNILTTVLRSGEAPPLTRPQMHRVMRAHRAHLIYMRYRQGLADSDDDEGPQDDDAWLYEDLTVLAKLYERLRDREELIGLIFEGVTAELLKDIITIFYAPLAQVYRAASIADSIGDLQNFINDLIKTVESTEELSQEDPQRTVQAFIELVQRHEQSFYSFVHKVHSKGEGLFDSLMRWIELFLTVIREGISDERGQNTISLEFLLPHKGSEREAIMKEVDDIAKYHYSLKLAHEDKIRRRFGKTQQGVDQGDAEAEDEAAQALVNGVVRELSFGELVRGDADELAAEDSEEDSEEDSDEETDYEEETDSSEYETGSDESSTEVERTKTSPIVRSATVGHPPVRRRIDSLKSATQGKQSLDSARPPIPSLPLRTSRSMTFSHPSNPRRHDHSNAPPVPPLPPLPPKDHLVSPRDKPLPPSPAPPRQRASVDELRRKPHPLPLNRPQPTALQRRKKRLNPDKQPDLHHIPQLLPLFVEMMRPLLRPRQS
ncbi:hypothetical protein GLOTRDRAFT_70534 [Gloeophyllum trabeum ATCC 11539]|uniref:PX domain-containing protein n=1 Tax=Gloeophyllum trabeum (strain ATCC 11539 / FP-39264 / Madison 617) TaxID=670483 RepID=S7QIT2_GLOTA|nr:uncharacterized protein GLOTRDRAFT_70534 [Gloeophyllum trabeum ATCC 11539]EPQ59257.1 hypothetical protein GLOTRDRAFT_70534 [Gloeophyllum trabeum ATCC 11539]